jgi:hypothetical protein
MSHSSNVMETLLAERERRWRSGQPMMSEDCLQQFAVVRGDSEAAVNLIYQEYCLRVEQGEKPSREAFLRRFPDHADRLLVQFQLRSAITGLARTASNANAEAASVKPFRVGRFELRKPLGESESATLYKAVDRRRGAKAVIQVFEVNREERLPLVKGLRDRIRQFVNVRHANLQRIHGLGVCKGHPYVVMDYVRGVSLASWFERRKSFKSIRRAVNLVGTASKALAALHDAGVVHGGVALEHFLLTDTFEPVLTLPRLLNLAEPEMTAANDVQALGLILHRMLTGRAPDSNPPMIHRPEIDPVLDTIVRQVTAPAAANRFASGRVLAEALSAWLKRNAFR